MDHCIACGMPLEKDGDVGTETDEGKVCKFCVTPDGTVKSCEEIFNGGVQFFMKSVPGTDRKLAERITRKNMNSQPHWKGKDNECLKGEEATDEEFQEVLGKLHSEIKKGKVNV
jgi:hypothetical protein